MIFPIENTQLINHQNVKLQVTSIVSSIDFIVISDNIMEIDILNYLNILESLKSIKYSNHLINILDCTSNTLRNFWMSNTSDIFWLETPEFFLIDKKIKYNPMITINKPLSSLSLRWVSYEKDFEKLTKFEQILDISEEIDYNFIKMYEFITSDMKSKLTEIDLIGLIKMIVLDTYTLTFEVRDLSFNLNKITYHEFNKLWSSNLSVRNRIINLVDPYYAANVIKFIDKFLGKLSLKNIDYSTTMKELYINEINSVFEKLKKYFNDDFTEMQIPTPITREYVYDYLRKCGIQL